MNNVYEANKDNLLSLGFAFHGKIPRKSADPERTIVDVLQSFFVDRKLFRMLLTWLGTTTELIHIERLKALSKDLSPNLKVVLAVVAKKLARQDRRWKFLYEHLKVELQDQNLSLQVPKEFNDPYLVSKYGPDEDFAEFGVDITKVAPEDGKKILSLRGILNNNSWLRLRAVMGPNFRADTAYLYLTNSAGGPAEVARILGCSRDTAYRNWRALENSDARKVLRISA